MVPTNRDTNNNTYLGNSREEFYSFLKKEDFYFSVLTTYCHTCITKRMLIKVIIMN